MVFKVRIVFADKEESRVNSKFRVFHENLFDFFAEFRL
jgi:hypothetical protein